jgi:hypothetical protein
VVALQVRFYLFLINRLYLDALALRIGHFCTRVAARVNASTLFAYVMGLAAVVTVLSVSSFPGGLSLPKGIQFFVTALMLPLFPLHGLYVAAMVRYPGYIAIGLILLMPAAGLYGMSELLHGV